MKTQQELTALGLDSGTLAQFTGTEKHYRISRRHLLTDGTKHLVEQGACFWMMDAVASHFCEIDTRDWFVLVRVTVTEGRAVMVYEDGNDRELARQEIGSVRIFVFEARGVGLIHAVVRLWLTCWPFKAKGTLST